MKNSITNGKYQILPTVEVSNKEQLSIHYSPGVAKQCEAIIENPDVIYDVTTKNNQIAVISNGTAVLGLGDIGALASIPVLEGKAILFKEFGGVDAISLAVDTQNVEEFINIVEKLSINFAGINLEDISAPDCFEIEKKLKEKCDIPIFHDDQHGTAIVVGAALINSLKLVDKKISDIKVVLNGPGAAGTAIIDFIRELGCTNIIACDENGILSKKRKDLPSYKKELLNTTNLLDESGLLIDAITNADVFIGTSVANCFTAEHIKKMSSNPIVFACANPNPEISPVVAKENGVKVICTGRSDYPNQVNNILAFPGIFRAVLNKRAKSITKEMKIAACYAIASCIESDELSENYVIPSIFDKKVTERIVEAIEKLC